jgi:hypothetical protein
VAWQIAAVALLASLVGVAELVGRYRADPWHSLVPSGAALLYIILNAVAGVGALLLIRAFNWDFGQTEHVDIWQVLVASFGAVAFFRSALFVARIGGEDVGVGPSLILQVLLDACDRQVDRAAAGGMARDVAEQLNITGLSPIQVMDTLPVLCLALMQNFAAADQALLGAELSRFRTASAMGDEAKMLATTIALTKYLGIDVVRQVLSSARPLFELSDQSQTSGPPTIGDRDNLLKMARDLVDPPGAEPVGRLPP